MVAVGIFRGVSSLSPAAPPTYPNTFHTHAQQALEEFGSIELGDLRSNRRLVQVFGLMLNSPGKSIPQCTHSVAEAKAFYRLLDHDVVTDERLFDVHCSSVLKRARASDCTVLLAIQDTTTCNDETHASVNGLGSISSNPTSCTSRPNSIATKASGCSYVRSTIAPLSMRKRRCGIS